MNEGPGGDSAGFSRLNEAETAENGLTIGCCWGKAAWATWR